MTFYGTPRPQQSDKPSRKLKLHSHITSGRSRHNLEGPAIKQPHNKHPPIAKHRIYFCSTLQRESPGATGQFFLLSEVQVESHDGAVRHDGRGDRASRFCRREKLIPILHDRNQRVDAHFRRTCHQPSHHFASSPIEWRQSHPHNLKTAANDVKWQKVLFARVEVNVVYRIRTCKPSSKATLKSVGCLGPFSGVAKRKASWASLNKWEELWICLWDDSKTVRRRITSPKQLYTI